MEYIGHSPTEFRDINFLPHLTTTMNALRQSRMLRHWPTASLISTRRQIAASTASIKSNLLEHQFSKTKPSVRYMTTERLSNCLEETRQLNAMAIDEYKEILDYLTEETGRVRAGTTYWKCDCSRDLLVGIERVRDSGLGVGYFEKIRDLDLAVGFERVLLECQWQMQRIIEKDARDVAPVVESLPGHSSTTEHEKLSVRSMTTAGWTKGLSRDSQKDAQAIQIYKDVANKIKQKREEARAWHDLDLAVDLGLLLVDCKSHLRKRIEKVAREIARNTWGASPAPAESKKLETRLDLTEARIRLLLGMEDYLLNCARKEHSDTDDIKALEENYSEWTELTLEIERLSNIYDVAVVDKIAEIQDGQNELHVRYDKEVLDKFSQVEDDLEDIWQRAVPLMDEKSRGNQTVDFFRDLEGEDLDDEDPENEDM
jgi:hypothetical protein